jgi:hypothetical protein
MRSSLRTDGQEKMTVGHGMQQWYKEPRHKRAIISGKHENTQQETFRQTVELEVAKQIVGTCITPRKMSVRTLWRDQQPLKQKRRLHKE